MATAGLAIADEPEAIYRGTWEVVKFDVSPALRDFEPVTVNFGLPWGGLMVDPESDYAGPLGPQDFDFIVQPFVGGGDIPSPVANFDGPPNVAGYSPPDPVGDVGPNHYVAMSNVHFAVYDKNGAVLYGPSANNTLWGGFGGLCESSNDGDPIVLHDQLSDRWILTQFAIGSTNYNCVAVSTTSDPLGTYYRWAFSTGPNMPDYPKYGVWPDALYISTREFNGPFVGVGAYAINRAHLVAGNPTPTVIAFLATPASAGGAYNVGDGLLPSDLDGMNLPPAGSPNYFMGSMDDGGNYGAPQDALTLWKFTADFATPANSTFVLANTIPITPYDTMAAFCSGRSCVSQPGTANKIDHLGYRQRPMHRLAYRNLGDHESLVTNQSVEASATISGIRWWEVRDPNGTPVVYQEGTYAPGTSDGVHRWMGSIAMDQSGNMALGYSASDGSSTYPSSWYTGRLADDPLGVMSQGEASFIDGTGSQTGSQRWGDYTSMNIDPVDDCTFWYVNQYLPTTSSVGWRLRVGAFVFDTCGCELIIVPPTASAGVGGPNLIQVGWNDSATPEMTEYRVYRSFTDGGPYDLLATVPDSSPGVGGGVGYTFNDFDVSGGTEYFYVVRSSDGGACLSDPSNQVSAVATGDCTLAPLFGGVETVLNPALNECTLELGWSAATSRCGGSVTYNVYRSTMAGFLPAVQNQIAGGVAGTGYVDGGPLLSQVRHYYVVRAVDSVNGAEEENTEEGSGVPTGPFSIGTWTDDAGDTGDAMLTPDSPWSVAPSGGNLGPKVYLTGTYPNSTCASVTTPSMILGAGANLSFWSKYQIENSWDKGVVEISSDGGSTWAKVPVNYPGTSTNTSDSCGLPTGTYFTGSTTGLTWTQYSASLATWDGLDVILRWRLSTDGSVTYQGWWVDDISITNVMVPSDCNFEPPMFADDFETGTTNAWALTVP